MNLSKSFFIIGTLLVSSFSTVVSKGHDTFLPPAPPKTIEPIRLPPNIERGSVRMRLIIDESGHARKITVLSKCDQAVEAMLLTSVAKWQFTPAIEKGRPVESEVILPLRLVDLSGSGSRKMRL